MIVIANWIGNIFILSLALVFSALGFFIFSVVASMLYDDYLKRKKDDENER